MRFLFVALALLPVRGETSDWQSGVAQVSAKDKSPGSGFVVAVRSSRAYILTCAHVVEGDPKPSITFHSDPEQKYPATVRHLQGGRMDGLALLVVDEPPANLHALKDGTNSAEPGTPVMIAGYPSSVGGFTVLHTSIASIQGTELYLERETEEGFSGGPVMLNGEVAGMVFGRGGGFGRAVPVAIIDVYLRGLNVPWGIGAMDPPLRKPGPVTVRENAKDGLNYVWISAGKFTMGCSPGDSECYPDEKPPHPVEITRGFWMGQTEVTQSAYQNLMKANPSFNKGTNRPVEEVSWNDAKAYCEAAGLRLPTEAEWEYAARAGNTEPRYGPLDQIAWYLGNSRIGESEPVATKHPNAWGLYDMLGNVWEWTADWNEEGYYSQKVSKDPKGPASSPKGERVMRGGSFTYSASSVRVSVRGSAQPSFRNDNSGFRCAGELR